MKFSCVLPVLALLAAPVLAQTTPPIVPAPVADSAKPVAPRWRKWGKMGLGLNESLLSSNWRGGGVNTIGFNALANVKRLLLETWYSGTHQ